MQNLTEPSIVMTSSIIDSVKEFERVILTGDESLLGPALQFLESNALAATSSYTQVGQSFECI